MTHQTKDQSLPDPSQESLFADTPEVDTVLAALRDILRTHAQPSAWELLGALEHRLGLKARWAAADALGRLSDDRSLAQSQRSYLTHMLQSDDWRHASRGAAQPGRDIVSTIDGLFQASTVYRYSAAFREMVTFMANFREYAPFNNMLVRLQNPTCSFFATEQDWVKRFQRRLKQDARPMVILAPMHPVMLVYDLDSTEGPPLPEELQQFAHFEGEWDLKRLARTARNAFIRDLIRVETTRLSSANAGFATVSPGNDGSKIRICLHEGLDEASRYGVLLHELAHVYLGHLGGDEDGWWPSRGDLAHRAMEVEAEAVAYIVGRRAGLKGTSPQYVSRYLDDETLRLISLDHVAKVAGRLDQMGTSALGKRRPGRRSRSTRERPWRL